MKKRLRVIIPLLLVAAVSLAFWVATRDHAAAPAGKIVGNGTIETTEVDVTSRVPAKLVAAPFQEGDWVRLGERVAVLDNADLAAQVGQAEAASEAAQANLDELLAGTRSEEITRARAQYEAALDTENQAQAKLDLVRAGTRSEEVKQLQAGVRQAQAALTDAERELHRTENLEKKGAVPGQQVDRARTQRDIAAAQLQAAQQRLAEAQKGARPEELRAAQAAFGQAQAQVRAAEAAVELAQAGPRRETIAAGRAKAAQAQAAVAMARTQLGYSVITAPLDGAVTLRNLEPGEYVTPGTPILRLAALDRVWLRVYVAETDLGRVKLGQRAAVSCDTYPGKTYAGRVTEIAQQAEFTPKNVQTKQERQKLVFGVRIDVENPQHELKPGMPADASIDVSR